MELEHKPSLRDIPTSFREWIRSCAILYQENNLQLPLLFTLGFIINLTSLAIPIGLMNTFEHITPNKDISTLLVIFLAVTTFFILEIILKYLRYYITTFSSARFENGQSKELIKNTILDLTYYNVGTFQYSLNEIQRNKELYSNNGLITLTEAPFILVYFAILLYIAPIFAILAAISLIGYFLVTFISLQRLARSIRLKHFSEIKRTNLIFRTLNNLITIRNFGRINLFINRFNILHRESVKKCYQVRKSEHRNFNFSQLIEKINITLIIAFGAILMANNSIKMGALFLAIYISMKCISSCRDILNIFTRLHEIKLMEGLIPRPSSHPAPEEDIEIDKVYSMVVPITIDEEEYEIPFMKGDTISLTNIDENLYNYIFSTQIQNLSQKVLINNHPLQTIPELSLYKKIAILNGMPNIWDGTIKENITSFGIVDESKANHYMEVLGLNEIINDLPDGPDTYITAEDTSTISSSVKSLIYITRKLALEPEVIFLNEFEVNINHKSYSKIYHHIANIRDNKIIFINSKDNNLLNLCNRDLLNNQLGEFNEYLI